MTENNTPSPTSGKLSDKLKTLAIQGLLGTISLTAAAIIPILVQRFFTPPTSVVPASTVPGAAPVEIQSQTNPEPQLNVQSEGKQRGRERNRSREEDDD
ncbi:hypothetical protein H6G89_18030 [Oscillatoria sp. FACHB-1407]|uniref:hypothetical protein n=1 Tax=Oscillatoria sp. FACHB-1407 TaxID=2692847 RepID=UPI001689B7BD|nr:hypothetical protein [Oscillatoria sp. FACHB-1407]MBD2462941.1 hypothetical protein [Oscillatoria sp. FACHB-1407]